MHIHFSTPDIRWAIALAGTVVNSRMGVNAKINPPHTFSFEPITPLIAHLANSFDSIVPGTESYRLPTEEQYQILDYFSAANISRTLQEQHGVKQPPIVIPLYTHALAYNSLLMTHGIASKAGYYFPTFSKNQLRDAVYCDALIESKEFLPQATRFCEGMGIESPKITSIEDIDMLTAAKTLSTTKVLVSRPYHPLQHIMRSWYNGYDFLANYIPVLSIIDDTVKQDDRYLVSWSGQIPVFNGEGDDSIRAKGKAYTVRKSYNFDHRAFLKDFYQKQGKI